MTVDVQAQISKATSPDKLTDLEWRVAALEARVFRLMPAPESDGWISNGHGGDQATLDMLMAEYGAVRVGEPRPTKQRDLASLKADGIVGLYAVPAT